MPPVKSPPKPNRFLDVALLRTGDQRAVVGLLLVGLAIMGGLRLRESLAGRRVVEFDALPVREAPFVVDLNRADAAVLAELPSVGPGLAARIIEYRRENGPFRSIEALHEVKGIGPKTFEAIRPHVFVKADEPSR
jgi:competence ComEA-like helix-hairpin-helix protein